MIGFVIPWPVKSWWGMIQTMMCIDLHPEHCNVNCRESLTQSSCQYFYTITLTESLTLCFKNQENNKLNHVCTCLQRIIKYEVSLKLAALVSRHDDVDLSWSVMIVRRISTNERRVWAQVTMATANQRALTCAAKTMNQPIKILNILTHEESALNTIL